MLLLHGRCHLGCGCRLLLALGLHRLHEPRRLVPSLRRHRLLVLAPRLGMGGLHLRKATRVLLRHGRSRGSAGLSQRTRVSLLFQRHCRLVRGQRRLQPRSLLGQQQIMRLHLRRQQLMTGRLSLLQRNRVRLLNGRSFLRCRGCLRGPGSPYLTHEAHVLLLPARQPIDGLLERARVLLLQCCCHIGSCGCGCLL